MRAATCMGGTLLAAFLALAGPRAALAITPDAWITTRAKMALLATEGLRQATINVDTVNGRVRRTSATSSRWSAAPARGW